VAIGLGVRRGLHVLSDESLRLLPRYLSKRTDLFGSTQSELDKIALRLDQGRERLRLSDLHAAADLNASTEQD
jgi:hypothetical protein